MTLFLGSWARVAVLSCALACAACYGLRDESFSSAGASLEGAFTALGDGLSTVFDTFFDWWATLIREHPVELRLTMEQSCEQPVSCPVPEQELPQGDIATTMLELPCIPTKLGFDAEFEAMYLRCVSRCEQNPHCLAEALFLSHPSAEHWQLRLDCRAAQSECSFTSDACDALAALDEGAPALAALKACLLEPCETRQACFSRAILPELLTPLGEASDS